MIFLLLFGKSCALFLLTVILVIKLSFSKQSVFDEDYVRLEAFSRKQNETRGETPDVHVFMVASDHPASAGRGGEGVSLRLMERKTR